MQYTVFFFTSVNITSICLHGHFFKDILPLFYHGELIGFYLLCCCFFMNKVCILCLYNMSTAFPWCRAFLILINPVKQFCFDCQTLHFIELGHFKQADSTSTWGSPATHEVITTRRVTSPPLDGSLMYACMSNLSCSKGLPLILSPFAPVTTWALFVCAGAPWYERI